MIILGRAIGLFVLCILVGLFLESIGITARGILTDTWHTLDLLWQKLRDLVVWSVPYALLGAIIVVPLALLSLVDPFAVAVSDNKKTAPRHHRAPRGG